VIFINRVRFLPASLPVVGSDHNTSQKTAFLKNNHDLYMMPFGASLCYKEATLMQTNYRFSIRIFKLHFTGNLSEETGAESDELKITCSMNLQ
jgi:hypothetical protein